MLKVEVAFQAAVVDSPAVVDFKGADGAVGKSRQGNSSKKRPIFGNAANWRSPSGPTPASRYTIS